MPKRLIFILTLLLMVAVVLTSSLEAKSVHKSVQPSIRVGVWSNQSNVLISAAADFMLINVATGKKLATFSAGAKAAVSISNGKLLINGKQMAARAIRVAATNERSSIFYEVNRKRYRGVIEIYPTVGASGLTVVNTLPMEDYLYGVVPVEMPVDWPQESLKAQAVAARTFALQNLHKHENSGYDVCATTHCQVYGGQTSEAAATTQAVDATYGQAIMYGGKPIMAFFHASSGGVMTESSQDVWGGSYPYLRSVVDFDKQSPYVNWEKRFAADELDSALKRAGYNVGKVEAIGLSLLDTATNLGGDRSVSGRVKSVRFYGSTRHVELTGAQVRTILSLPSTLFEFKTLITLPKSIDVDISNDYGIFQTKQIDVNVPPRAEAGLAADQETLLRIRRRSGEFVQITGSGSGHGVGLSQWGAKAMAEQSGIYFQDILKHYYPGIEVQNVY